MKDKIFIVWSGSNKIALKVKEVLESKYNYLCSIGGNSDNDSTFSSIGDTVLQQIKNCNQAIVIFQNKENGAVSNNLFFELGYVLARYGQKKIHCVKRKNEKVVLPTDFDNSFVESVNDDTEEAFVEGIVKYFMNRQKMSINTNKMFLINNRYLLQDYMRSHYSEFGSKCSDYELAQYLLFYMQAGHMFGDEKKLQREITEFKQAHCYDFSSELTLAVNMCLSFFHFILNLKFSENGQPYIDKSVFIKFKGDYEMYEKNIALDDIGTFDEWARVFVYEHLAYGYNLFAANPELSESMRNSILEMMVVYAEKALDAMKVLEQTAPIKEYNDDIGILSLLRAYVYRNLYLASRGLGKEDSIEWLQKTTQERMNLKHNFELGSIDSKLYDNFSMEYYLALLEYLSNAEHFNISEFDKMLYMDEVAAYIQRLQDGVSENNYITYISNLFKTLQGEN